MIMGILIGIEYIMCRVFFVNSFFCGYMRIIFFLVSFYL